ncbi:hypothetical protein LEMLEM_LOCUS9271 [Lemmus lemmus]
MVGINIRGLSITGTCQAVRLGTEKDVQGKQDAQGLARWASRNLEMPAAVPYYALISVHGDQQNQENHLP